MDIQTVCVLMICLLAVFTGWVLLEPMCEFSISQAAKLPLIEMLDPMGDWLNAQPERPTPVLDLLRSGVELTSERVNGALYSHNVNYGSNT